MRVSAADLGVGHRDGECDEEAAHERASASPGRGYRATAWCREDGNTTVPSLESAVVMPLRSEGCGTGKTRGQACLALVPQTGNSLSHLQVELPPEGQPNFRFVQTYP